MSIVHKFAGAAATALADKRQVLTSCSAGGVDRQGDIVVQGGIDTKSFMKAGGTVLWGHNPACPIARAIPIGLEGGQLRSLVQFPDPGVSARADEVYGLIKAGIVNCTSIGFAPVSWEPIAPPGNGRKYTAVELMEFSFVSVPAMPDATVIARRLRQRGADPASIDGEAARASRRRLALDALDRADVGRVVARRPAEVREIGGGYLVQSVRAAAQEKIWDSYR